MPYRSRRCRAVKFKVPRELLVQHITVRYSGTGVRGSDEHPVAVHEPTATKILITFRQYHTVMA